MLKNRGVMVEIFIGHINKNDEGDKGLDDLLANKLSGHEEELAGKSSVSCPLKPSDSAPLKHSTMPP